MRKILINIIFIFISTVCSLHAQSTYTCMNNEIDTIRFSDFSSIQSDTIFSRPISLADAMGPNQDPTCGNRLQKVKMYIKVDVGEDYIYGNINWALSYNLKVKVKQTGNVLFDDNHTFDISQFQPEELWVLDYPNICFFYFSDELEFEITVLNSAGMTTDIEDDFRMHVYYVFEEKFDVDDVTIDLDPVGSGLITDNPVTFNWTPSCECTPNYEFQLLKFENVNPNQNSPIFRTVIDWYKALTIETQSSDPSLTLTLPEGTGHYLWRVRPIGDYYAGGYGNSRNWGKWSDFLQWNYIDQIDTVTVNFPIIADLYFNYQQFDDTLNWIYSRQFSEAERTIDGKIKMSEEMTYANGLQQVRQHQRHLFSQGNIVANHTGIDFSGRPALSTIYAPITNQNHLGYVDDMAINTGSTFNASHFDTDVLSIDPLPIVAGKITDYYDNGLDLTIPSSEGYPFTRTLFYGDGMNRVKESSGVGEPLRIKSNDTLTHTTKYFYSGVADQELIRVFGDEAPNANSVIKMITVDPNKTTTVSYQTKEGQTIATCLSASNNEAYHDTLISRQAFTLHDTISGDISCGDGCLLSSKTVGFGSPTTVDFTYTIAPSTVDAFCDLACTTCEYQIVFLFKRVDDPFDPNYPKADTLTLPPDLCTNTILQTWSTSHSFDPGTYQIERRIQIGNTDPSSYSNTNLFGYSYLQTQLFELEQSIQDAVQSDLLWNTIQTYLQNSEINQLYTYLEQNHNLLPTDTVFSFNTSCCTFELPIIRCEDCPIENRDYEAYYQTVNSTTALSHLPGYSTGQFNAMLVEMIDNHGYSEQSICDCWTGITQSWENIANETYTIDGQSDSPGLLHTFLTCTGYKFANSPFATTDHEPYTGTTGGYLSHAFSHFEYDINDPSDCEANYCAQGTIGSDGLAVHCVSGSINWNHSSISTWTNDHWLEFYMCTQSNATGPFAGDIEQEIIEFTEEMSDACLSACESRHQSYIAALVYYYETQAGLSVDSLESVLDTCQSCISYDVVLCQADQLVEHCQSLCGTLDLIVDAASNPIGVDASFIEGYYKAMYYAFNLEFPINGSCQQGWDYISESTVVVSSSFPTQQEILDTLNSFYQAIIPDIQTYTPIDLEGVLDILYPGLSDYCTTTQIYDYESRGFFMFDTNCNLIFNTSTFEGNSDILIAENLCQYNTQDTLVCPSICIRYFEINIDTVDHIFEPITCAEQTADFTNGLLQAQLLECQQSKVSEYEYLYTNTCLDPSNIQDTFALEYKLGYYHYTLYYYDRANNLVQTVAPAGVHETTTSRLQNTTHDYKTQYRYNTLKQLIWQYSPDGGTTEFLYDSKGQLRFSQNAQQKLDGTCAYTKYDYLGRIIDVGKYTFDALTFPDLDDPYYFDDPDFPQTNDPQSSERVLTVYSEPYPYPLSGGMIQTYLQNRVSYTHTDPDGDLTTDTDQVTTIYSYDVHGNVNTLIQDIMPDVPSPREIRQFRIDYNYDLISNKVIQMDYMKGRADQFFHRYRYDEDNRITQVETSRNGLLWDRDARYTYYNHGPLKRTLLGEDQIQGIDYIYTIQGWLKSINHPTLDESMDPGGDGYGSSIVPKDVFASALTYFENDFMKPGSNFDDTQLSSPYHGGLDPIRNLYNGNITQWTSNSYVDQVANPDFVHPGWTGRQFRYDELNRLVDSDFSFYDNAWYVTDEYDSNYSYDANGNILSLNREAYLESGTSIMDSLAYSYNAITPFDPSNFPLDNQLDSIVDLAYGPSNLSPYDSDLEQRYWYEYDAIGNLVKDTSSTEPKLDITWNLKGKVDLIEKGDGTELDFEYDALGNRVMKKYLNGLGEKEYTYFIKDSNGNIISEYQFVGDIYNEYSLILKSNNFFGVKPIGFLSNNVPAFGKSSYIGSGTLNVVYLPNLISSKRNISIKKYQLLDHLNNVRTVIVDSKSNSYELYNNDIINYYPFGMEQISRNLSGNSNIGFQNQEIENELHHSRKYSSFKSRMYNSSRGAFISTDPLFRIFPSNSPYSFSENDLIRAIDFEGNQKRIIINSEWYTTKIIQLDLSTEQGVREAVRLANRAVGDMSPVYDSDAFDDYPSKTAAYLEDDGNQGFEVYGTIGGRSKVLLFRVDNNTDSFIKNANIDKKIDKLKSKNSILAKQIDHNKKFIKSNNDQMYDQPPDEPVAGYRLGKVFSNYILESEINELNSEIELNNKKISELELSKVESESP